MSAEIKALIAKLREEVDKKCRAQHQSIDELAADLLGQAIVTQEAHGTTSPTAPGVSQPSTVQRVLGAIAGEYKPVSQIAEELGLDESKVRAALYSKFVKRKVASRKHGTITEFKAKPEVSATGASTEARNLAAEVRGLLAAAPQGLTQGQVLSALGSLDAKQKKAVGAALYSMKDRGKLTYENGVYKFSPASVTSNGQG